MSRDPTYRLIERIAQAYATPVEPVSREPFTAPERIGRFPLEGILGIGGMGVVYRGRDPRLDRPVAIKTLPPDLARNAAARARLEHEARLLASVNHPGIATIHGIEEDERGSVFLILELVRGETLSQRLSHGPLPVEQALSIASETLEALATAHEAGVLHGDLKPGNLMLQPGGRVKVLDFGLARRFEPSSAEGDPGGGRLPATDSSVVGTPGYIAPERLAGRSGYGSDLFSWACLFYEALAGTPAFVGASGDDLLQAVLCASPDLSRIPSGLPDSVHEVLAQCFERDPEKRPSGARRVLEVLLAAAGRAAGPRVADAPETASPFIGREREVGECIALLREGARLVTLTGIGGSGKTRLAIEVARQERAQFPHGVRFADLARISSAEEVIGVIAASVEAVESSDGESLSEALERRLQDASTLLVLDNAEHVVDPVANLAQALLSRCSRLHLLVTSRQPLGLTAERVLRVPTLPVPDPGPARSPESLARVDSVALFVDRARHASPQFTLTSENAGAVAQIVRQVEGLPLAVELAAARCHVLSPEEIAARLDRPLSLLRGRQPSSQRRHATMRAALAWSADMLEEDEARAFRRLAICAGGFDLDAACQVAGVEDSLEMVDILSRLADKSLIEAIPKPGRPTRYRMLEPVRDLARERLEAAGETEATRDRHASHFVHFAEMAEPELVGERATLWLDRVEDEYGNLVAAFDRLDESPHETERMLRLAGSLWRLGRMRGCRSSCYRLAERALARSHPEDRSQARARALFASAALWPTGPEMNIPTIRRFEEAARLFALAGDRQWEARSRNGAGMAWSSEMDPQRAKPHFERAAALYREIGDDRGLATVLHNQARDAWLRRDLPEALAITEECLATCATEPERALKRASMAVLQLRMGRTAEARKLMRSAIPHLGGIGVRHDDGMTLLLGLAELAERERRDEEAARLLGAADGLVALLGWRLSEEDYQWHEHDATMTRLRERLTEERFRELYEAGQSLTPEEAVKEGQSGLFGPP